MYAIRSYYVDRNDSKDYYEIMNINYIFWAKYGKGGIFNEKH